MLPVRDTDISNSKRRVAEAWDKQMKSLWWVCGARDIIIIWTEQNVPGPRSRLNP